MKIVVGHIDDRFAPEMYVTIEDAEGKTLDHRCGYSPYNSIAKDVATNAVEMLQKLKELPRGDIEILVEKGSERFYGQETRGYIQEKVDKYLAER